MRGGKHSELAKPAFPPRAPPFRARYVVVCCGNVNMYWWGDGFYGAGNANVTPMYTSQAPSSAAPRAATHLACQPTHQGNSSLSVPVIPARERLMTAYRQTLRETTADISAAGNQISTSTTHTRPSDPPLDREFENFYITPIGFSAASVVSPTMLRCPVGTHLRERPYIRPPHPCPSHTQYCIITSYNIPPHFVTQNCVFVAYPKKPGGPPK